ncbi:MAG: sensor histidine kinase [Candidatus Cryosericum sp.]
MGRVFKSLTFQIIVTALLIVGISMAILSNRLIVDFQDQLITKETETLQAIGSQAVERWNRMYRELYSSYKFNTLSQEKQNALLSIFLSKSYNDYIALFKSNFPNVSIGYQVNLFSPSLVYLGDASRNPLSKLTVALPLKAGTQTLGYLIVDRDMPQVLAPLQRVRFEAFKTSTISIAASGAATIVLLAFFLIRLLALRRSVVRLGTNLDARVPQGGGELGEISRAVANLALSLKRSIEEAKQTEALKTLGIFTTGIAHEVRNPLTSIKGYASLLEKKLQGRPEAKYVVPIRSEADRLELLVKDLLTFGRPSPIQPVPFDLAEFFGSLGELMNQQFEEGHAVLDLQVPHITVTWDARQTEQMFMNLLQNAIQALQDKNGGAVTVVARTDADRVIVEVRDTGVGIRDEDKPKMFTPFFTTKEHGTGLGLPISQKIASIHNGVITYESSAGVGTTFTVNMQRVVNPAV